jgi:hypothetical protein
MLLDCMSFWHADGIHEKSIFLGLERDLTLLVHQRFPASGSAFIEWFRISSNEDSAAQSLRELAPTILLVATDEEQRR